MSEPGWLHLIATRPATDIGHYIYSAAAGHEDMAVP
jgi:hypothetical protein